MAAPFGDLAFLYVGSADVGRDLRYFTETLGARKLWDAEAFGTRVAAVALGSGPQVLLAGHRPAPSCIPVYRVEDLAATARALRGRGWKPEGEAFEIPNGPCYLFHDPSGNPWAFFEDVRPEAMEGAREEADRRATRGPR